MKKSIITDQVDMDFEKALKIIKKYNYKNVEIHSLWNKTIENITIEEAYNIKKLLGFYDLNLICLSTTLFLMCPLYENYNISDFGNKFLTFKGNIKEHFQKMEYVIKIANILNTDKIRIFPFRAPNDKEIIGDDEDFSNIKKYFKQLSEKYKHENITFILENCPHSYLPNSYMTGKLLNDLNVDNIKLLWDPGNSFRANYDRIPKKYIKNNLFNEIENNIKNIYHIHLKDYKKNQNEFEHEIFLEGDIDYNNIINKLKEYNYDYSLSLESEVNFEKTIKSMNNLNKII
ncbi:sugar phosphate isomerase/epimerase [Oceanotoga teriensis]|jgi:sugar phosphate isomerase/epimerase|uniref:Sugar phosphate isomerase/epimerase n=1 Tax=Oceanotoga teriensis TaxID=515440 RepID=A0AA45C5G9_9BACT|nr:sugar phosphate isomerase/epimerase [Oceanotoga teriensis]PWJ89005.1 sugar phosphate isomerase/epimerase [Oceanotoga teriensis]